MSAAAKVIIDCDPGVDDAIALLLALAAPEAIDLLGITCVAGNVPLASTLRNARRIRTLAQASDIPVLAGCDRPLMKRAGHLSSAHGADGLGGVELPDGPKRAADDVHAVDFLIEAVRQAPGEVTLWAIGPLTNIAVALIKHPELAPNIKEIVLMGGAAFRPGNSTPVAEFNIFGHIVFDAGVPITMFGLDVTSKASIEPGWLSHLADRPSRSAMAAAQMMQSYGRNDVYLHDPCVIAFLIERDLFAGLNAHVSVVTEPGAAFGQTIASVKERHLAGREPNCRVITEVDSARLFALLLDRLGRLP